MARLRDGSRLVCTLVVGALCVLGALAPAALADAPSNDDRATPFDIVLDLTTTARYTADVTTGDTPKVLDVQDATTAVDDPVFRTVDDVPGANDLSTCVRNFNASDQGQRSVWFRLVAPDGGDPDAPPAAPRERRLIDLTTQGSTYNTVITVFRGSQFRHCEGKNIRGPGPTVYQNAQVVFTLEPGEEYIVGVAQADFGPPTPTYDLVLGIRSVDITAPTLGIKATGRAEPGQQTTLEVVGDADRGSGIADGTVTWSVAWAQPGGPEPTLVGEAGARRVAVTWPKRFPRAARGRVAVMVATLTDRAGNVGRTTLTLTIRDRTAPVANLGVRSVPGTRILVLTARCSEVGTVRLRVARQGASRAIADRVIRVRSTRRSYQLRSPALPLPSGVWITSARCTDAAGNGARTALGFFA